MNCDILSLALGSNPADSSTGFWSAAIKLSDSGLSLINTPRILLIQVSSNSAYIDIWSCAQLTRSPITVSPTFWENTSTVATRERKIPQPCHTISRRDALTEDLRRLFSIQGCNGHQKLHANIKSRRWEPAVEKPRGLAVENIHDERITRKLAMEWKNKFKRARS